MMIINSWSLETVSKVKKYFFILLEIIVKRKCATKERCTRKVEINFQMGFWNAICVEGSRAL